MIDGSSNIDVIGGEFNHNIRGFIDYPASCIRIDTNTANSKVMYVKSHDCESAGFVLEDGANNNLIAYNLFYNNARGGSFSSVPGQNNKIYNNVFYNNVGSDSGGLAIRSSVPVTVKNNIFFSNNKGMFFDQGGNILTHTIDYNLYFGNTIDIRYGGTSYSATQVQNGQYYAATGYEPHGIGLNPLFVNPTTFDFHLQQTSPAKDKGTNVGLTRDYDGTAVPQGSAVDAGAYEFTQVGPPQQCSDGTLYVQCSVNIPLYCSNGQLINNCQQCGCPQGQTCQANGSCLPQQNQPPIATITQPTQTSFTVNTSINYAGTGSDPEQCNLPGSSLCWSYDITGDQQSFINLGCRSSGTFTPTVIINNQSTQYILKLVATDSQGLSGNATKTLTINPIGGGEGNITNITYQENFESYNIGSIPPRWNIISGTWQITQDSSKVFSRLSSTSSSTTTLSNFTHDTYLFEGKVKVQNTFGIFMNYINSNNWYRVIYLGGTDFRLEKRYLGSATALTMLTYNPQLNNWYYFKFLIQKNNTQNLLKYKMWKVTDIEPSTWLIEYPDSQNILSGGTIGLYAHDSSSTLSFDDLKVSSNVISPQTCSDGTLYGQCSINQPLFCNNGTLENRCQQCGCTQGVTCQPDGTCQVIQNQPQVATITQPTQISFTVNTPINYAGTGSDPEQGNLPGTNLCWSYDITGDQQS